MAPVKIKYVVSFTSQDPKYPVENLLLPEGHQPWLSCPKDRSRQLKAELQLEQASRLGYIDVGNCGSAFLQIDVGRSSWPLGQSYCTLLPMTALMSPTDAKLDRNRSAVRMFKEGDFLASALDEKWDRVRLTCGQPFNKHTQFGLRFIQIRTQVDAQESKAHPPTLPSQTCCHPQAVLEAPDSPRPSGEVSCKTFAPTGASSTEEDVVLKSRLQQLDSSSSGAQSPVSMSRSARMVLKGASACKRVFPRPPAAGSDADGQVHSTDRRTVALGSKLKTSLRRNGLKARQWGSQGDNGRNGFRKEGKTSGQRRRFCHTEEEPSAASRGRRGPPEGATELGQCPICADHFPIHLLPAHASSCGEEDLGASPSCSPSSSEEPASVWVPCPLCQVRFPAAEVESHASSCGEPEESSVDGPSWLWVE